MVSIITFPHLFSNKKISSLKLDLLYYTLSSLSACIGKSVDSRDWELSCADNGSMA